MLDQGDRTAVLKTLVEPDEQVAKLIGISVDRMLAYYLAGISESVLRDIPLMKGLPDCLYGPKFASRKPSRAM
jgi:hypothetical protein